MVVIDEIKMTSTEASDKGLVDALIGRDQEGHVAGTIDELILGWNI